MAEGSDRYGAAGKNIVLRMPAWNVYEVQDTVRNYLNLDNGTAKKLY